MKNWLPVILFTLTVLLQGCSTTKKIEALKPEPSTNTPVVYETTTSFINLPVSITLADIETQVNKYLTGLIYEDNDINDDEIAMKVWKTSPITFKEQNGKLQSVVPIKILAQVKYGTSALGINMYDTREFNLDAVVTFNSTVGLSNWKMTTTTTLESLKWKESPTITIAGKKVAITYLINPAVKLFKSKIERKLDESIEKVADFKPQVLAAMEQLSNPILTNEQYEAWFKVNPSELYVTDAVLSKSRITMDMGLKCTMQTLVGQKPANNFKKETLVLKPVSKMPEKFSAVVAAVSTYESASKVITKNFQGQEFGDGSRKVTVQKVDLWHKDGKMIVALDMTGSINGTIYLAGYPSYNAATKEIYFDQMDYVLNTKSVLMKTANWLAGGLILRKIQESCRYSIQPNLEEGKKNMLPYLQNYSPMPGVFVNGSMGDFEFEKIQLTDKAIIAFIKTSGKMDVKIDGLK
jgi:type IV pilus biogenesis protein CpaD/CtpE